MSTERHILAAFLLAGVLAAPAWAQSRLPQIGAEPATEPPAAEAEASAGSPAADGPPAPTDAAPPRFSVFGQSAEREAYFAEQRRLQEEEAERRRLLLLQEEERLRARNRARTDALDLDRSNY